MEFNNLHQFGVTYEMNLDLTEYNRKVYGFLDWLSDLGGLSSALLALFGEAQPDEIVVDAHILRTQVHRRVLAAGEERREGCELDCHHLGAGAEAVDAEHLDRGVL